VVVLSTINQFFHKPVSKIKLEIESRFLTTSRLVAIQRYPLGLEAVLVYQVFKLDESILCN
jgi:hypothetical protein